MSLGRILFSFSGRINRAKYWLGIAIAYAVIMAATAIVLWSPRFGEWSAVFGTLIFVGVFSICAVAAKRLHDLNISAWWLLAAFVVLAAESGTTGAYRGIGSLVVFVLMIWLGSARGVGSTNKFDSKLSTDSGSASSEEPERSRLSTPVDWYLYDGHAQEGPLTYQALISRLGTFPDLSSVKLWRPGFEDWQPAVEVSDIAPVKRMFSESTPRPSFKGRYALYGLLAGVLINLLDYFVQWRGTKFLPWEGNDLAENIGYIGGTCGITTLFGFIIGYFRDNGRSSRAEPIRVESRTQEEIVEPISSGRAPITKSSNFILRSWRGEYSLAATYWGFAFLGNFAAGLIPVLVGSIFQTDSGYDPRAVLATLSSAWLGVGAIGIWQIVAVWRSANRHIEARTAIGKKSPWAGLTKLLVMIGCIRLAAAFGNSGVPQLTEAYRMAFLGDPDIPAYSIRVMRDGTEAEIAGGFKFGLTDDFAKVFSASRHIKVLHLNSVGGRIGEAVRLYKFIRSNGLSTYVSAGCYSACTVAFAGGRDRILREGAKLGFHAPAFPGMSKSELQDEVQSQVKIFTGAGFERAFVEKALSTPAEQLWKPTVNELLAANAITRISNGSDFAMSGMGTDIGREQLGAQLADAAPIIRSLQAQFPNSYDQVVGSYYDAFVSGKTDAEAASQAIEKLNQILLAIRPMADDQVLADLAEVYADQYASLNTNDPKLCYDYVSGNGNIKLAREIPERLLERERDLNRQAIETAKPRPKIHQALAEDVLRKFGARLAVKGVSNEQVNLAFDAKVTPSKYAEFCRTWISIYREIAQSKAADAALLMRQWLLDDKGG